MYVSQILKTKGANVVTARADDTIARVAEQLATERIGAVVVMGEGRIAGILSERDIAYGLARHGQDLLALRVSDLMSRLVATCSPEDDTGTLMEMMTDRRVRHLPVLDNGKLAGIISIGDVVKARLSEMAVEVNELRDYVAGRTA
ncbi:MAG TPA: CBS domain-containing protein [Alphaproteobacteria bacterium]